MLLLILCIIINAVVVSIFKAFEKYDIDVFQAIVVNYVVCVLTAGVILGDLQFVASLPSQPWIYHAVFISLFFVSTFTLIGKSVQSKGIVITSIFQKMSLIFAVLVAVLLYNEQITALKVIGLTIAVASIFVITIEKKTQTSNNASTGGWLFPILVLLGSSVIDVLFLVFEKEQIVVDGDIRFVASLFFSSGILGGAVLLYLYARGKKTWAWKNVIAGIALGIPNFFSIYWLLQVLSSGWEGSVVFPANNVGILAASAVMGYLFFQESIKGKKLVGLLMAITSIVILALSN